jgi:hypothetical protein
MESSGCDPTRHPPTNVCATCDRLPGWRGLSSVDLPSEPASCSDGRSSGHEIVAKNKVFRFAAIVKPLRTRWVYEWEGWSEKRKSRKFLRSIRPPHLISPPQVGMASYPIHLGGEVYSANSAIKNPPRRSTPLIISSLHREFHVCPTVSFVVTSEGNRAGLPLGGPSPSDCVLGIQ